MTAILLALLAAFTLEWRGPNQAGSIGYKVYWADNPALSQPAIIDCGTASSMWIPNPPDGSVRFAAVTAYLQLGTGANVVKIESLPSEPVFFPSQTLTLRNLELREWTAEQSDDLSSWTAAPAVKLRISPEGETLWKLAGLSLVPADFRWLFGRPAMRVDLQVPFDRPRRFFRLKAP